MGRGGGERRAQEGEPEPVLRGHGHAVAADEIGTSKRVSKRADERARNARVLLCVLKKKSQKILPNVNGVLLVSVYIQPVVI